MNLLSTLVSFFIAINPPSDFICDGELLTATIRNNLNGDFAVVSDLEEIDEGAFVVINWKKISLMLPISFQAGEISFTDNKWLWSYMDNKRGLHQDSPRFVQRLPNGELIEHSCNSNENHISELT